MCRLNSRRQFLATAAALVASAGQPICADEPNTRKPILDLHVHLVGVGDNGSGCVLSKSIQEGPLFKLLVEKLRVRQKGPTLDEGFVVALAEQVKNSGLDKCLLIAQDAVYDSAGKLDWRRTHFYVPNDYVFKVAADTPDLLVPCISINPDRADAIDELNRNLERGARVLKIHPPIQGVDLADQKHQRFFRRCQEAKVVVLVHTGHEHSAPVVDINLANPQKLRQALDEGCTVVACHSGAGRPGDEPDMLPEFLKLLRAYEKQGTLWGDTAVLGGLLRSRDFVRLLDDDLAKSRLLHGSDYPFPAFPLEFRQQIGAATAARLQLDSNLIRQDFALKDALGIGRASAERAYELIGRESTA
jgi:hypothetical protein